MIKLKKECKGEYTYKGKYNWSIGLMDDLRSFTVMWIAEGETMTEGWYGCRLKDIREIIYNWEF